MVIEVERTTNAYGRGTFPHHTKSCTVISRSFGNAQHMCYAFLHMVTAEYVVFVWLGLFGNTSVMYSTLMCAPVHVPW